MEPITDLWRDRRRRLGLPLSFTRYRLSRDRIFCEKGFLNLKVEEVLLYRVRDLELTMSLPYIVLGLSMLILFSSPAGKWLKETGFPVVFHQNGVILAQLVVNLPFAVRLCAAAFRGVDRKLECTAGLLGASPAQQFFTVLLPLSKNALISAVILVWSRALGEFGATLMLVGVTRMKTETLPGSIYLAVSTNNLDAALASAFLLLVLSALSLTAASLLGRSSEKRSRYV